MTWEEILQMQRELQTHYRAIWEQPCPEGGRSTLLWAMIEMGEMADIIKKKGDRAIMDEPGERGHFIEEFCDVLMYLGDLCLCYAIQPDALEEIYRDKHEKNMTRWDDSLRKALAEARERNANGVAAELPQPCCGGEAIQGKKEPLD